MNTTGVSCYNCGSGDLSYDVEFDKFYCMKCGKRITVPRHPSMECPCKYCLGNVYWDYDEDDNLSCDRFVYSDMVHLLTKRGITCPEFIRANKANVLKFADLFEKPH